MSKQYVGPLQANHRVFLKSYPALNVPGMREFIQIPDEQGRQPKIQYRFHEKDRWKILPHAINVFPNELAKEIDLRVKKPLEFWGADA